MLIFISYSNILRDSRWFWQIPWFRRSPRDTRAEINNGPVECQARLNITDIKVATEVFLYL